MVYRSGTWRRYTNRLLLCTGLEDGGDILIGCYGVQVSKMEEIY